MEYDQLERCYKTVLRQRDEAETKVIELSDKLDDLREAVEVEIRKTNGKLLRLKAALEET